VQHIYVRIVWSDESDSNLNADIDMEHPRTLAEVLARRKQG
jgi:hypothetical protein